MSDRFHGEPEIPPKWRPCESCGEEIHDGHEYYSFDELRICFSCAKEFAWQMFLDNAERRVAGD